MRDAINLSAHQLRHPDLADRIEAALGRHKINPQLLTCEITESVAMEDAQAAMRMVDRLNAIGVDISIDDFGTGYSSLAYLRKLRAGEHLILRSFGCHELQGFLFARPMSTPALSSRAHDEGSPRILDFRESLYRVTAAGALH